AGTLVTDVLVRGGRIAAVGDDLSADGVLEIDGSGKHLTPGIIDEHSHIALFNINETMTNSAMVRMQDVVDSENINIYRNLAGGVTAAQLLHGSANPIGGQSAIIKMRWGRPASELLIEGADEFIKFALGENVKRSRNSASIRYPQTRMGVEQVYVNAFSQAREYGKKWDEYRSLTRSQRRNVAAPRRNLVDETMLEILNGERYVTSHSYVQSEINMLINVADSFDFNINTFTHILEGYKVADKMALHGAGGSTFADWWGYKWEAFQAIPYNAALMQQAGVVVAINSDDAEMSRRLNQEAAKSVKYGGLSEIDAFKQVTINPAMLLHLDDRMGSIRAGKDADLVLWSDHPLSIYAVVETTWIEGIPYYDRDEDLAMREQIASERARIIAAIGRED
ncbi:MAG: amidohydrolase family protein, partial [Proteobacteria bacterium]|nr:amidohydrolase family protein [Pseudomonadota bacterium]